MTSTATISTHNRMAQSTGGRSDTHPAQSQDFIAALNRLAYASLSAAAVPFDITIPDTTAPDAARTESADDAGPAPDQAGRAPEPRDRDISADAPEGRSARDEAPSADDQEADTTRDAAERPATGPGSETPPSPEAAATVLPTPIDPRGQQPAAARQAAAQPSANATHIQAVQPADAETPDVKQPGTQAAHRGTNTAQSQITAQVTDGGDHLPQIGHTLSSRAAVVAQSDAAKAGAPADAAAKNTPTDATAASLLSGAAQPNGQAAKAKGQTKTGNGGSAANAANANGAQGGTQNGAAAGNQAAAANAQAAAQSLQQPKLAAAGTGDALTAGTSQTGSARSEPFTLAGPGSTASQFSPRGAAPTQVAKPPAPVPARFIANQVAVQIQKAFGAGGDRISIQLKPAELGRVEVRLDVGKEGRVSAVITADRADTLDLLQRDARILQNALQDAGLQTDGNSLSFQLKSQDQAFNQSNGAAGGASDSGDGGLPGAAEAAGAFTPQNIISQDRIDIRV